MLRWLARENSPIVSSVSTGRVSTIPLPEGQAKSTALTLHPGEDRGSVGRRPAAFEIRAKRRAQMPETTQLTGVVADHVAAINAGDLDAIVATFTPDAFVNDVSREFRGIDSIRRFLKKEIVGDNIVMDVREV